MKQVLKRGDEWDVVTGWRRVLCSYQRAGKASAVKRRLRRRIRREGKVISKEGYELENEQ